MKSNCNKHKTPFCSERETKIILYPTRKGEEREGRKEKRKEERSGGIKIRVEPGFALERDVS